MELAVLIEPLPNRSGFTARLTAPLQLSVAAATAEEAHHQLAALLQRRFQDGMELRTLTIPVANSGKTDAGWLPNDELTREWLDLVQQYRGECDATDRARVGLTEDPNEKPA
jgi:hypothetical protein